MRYFHARLCGFVAAIILSGLPCVAMAYDGALGPDDELLLSCHKPDALVTFNREGEITWRSRLKLKHPQQVAALADGRALVATIDGAVMTRPDGSQEWRYKVPPQAENATALELGEGRYLVAHEGRGELVELDARGRSQQVTKVEPLNDKTHAQFRYVGLGDGTYLVPMTNANTFREVDPTTGAVVWEIRDIPTVTSALRREDGGYFICAMDQVRSYSAARELEWTLSLSKDLGLAKRAPPTAMTPLPGGHLAIALWHTHADVPDVIEVDPAARRLVHAWYMEGLAQAAGIDRLPQGHTYRQVQPPAGPAISPPQATPESAPSASPEPNATAATAAPADMDWGPTLALAAPDGGVYLACALTQEIRFLAETGAPRAAQALDAAPTGMTLSPDGATLIVTAGEGTGWLCALDAKTLARKRQERCGHSPMAPRFSPDGKTLALAQRFRDEVWLLDTNSTEPRAIHAVGRQPIDLRWRDKRELVVLRHLSNRPATAKWTGCAMVTLDTQTGKRVEIPLEDGGSGARRMALTPDKRYALSAMVKASHRVPATQLEQGWVNKNGLSVVDLDKRELLGTLLLDEMTLGAPNPWAIELTAEHAWITLAGGHQLMRVGYPALIAALREMSPKQREDLTYDLRTGRAWKRRIPLQGRGPRALALAADGRSLWVASYFNNAVERVTAPDGRARVVVPPREIADARRGEYLFHDATFCFQQWMSCSSCHPGARTDALNWDRVYDGLGNPYQTKTTIFSHATPPTAVTGARPNAEATVRGAITFMRAALPEEDANAIDAYLRGLRPIPSPHLTDDGSLSPAAEAGRSLFFGKAACADCHSGEHYTNQQMVTIGTGISPDAHFDVPTVREIWRGAPYLHDGRAATLESIFTKHNPEELHGRFHQLNESERVELLIYLQSI